MGWEKCPWSDDSFSSKRLFPGSAPRTGSTAWRTRLTVTTESFSLMLSCQINKHKKLLQTGGILTKINKTKMEEFADQAALVSWLSTEIKAVAPLPEDLIYDGFVNPWIQNEPHVHCEMLSILACKADDFSAMQVTLLKAIADQHCGPRNLNIMEAAAQLEGHQEKVQEKEFLLMLSQFEYDTDVWRVFKQRCSDYSMAVHMQKHQWNVKRHENSLAAADTFLNQCCFIFVSKDAISALAEFSKWKKDILGTIQVQETSAHTVAVVNLAAPSLTSANDLEMYSGLTQGLMCGHPGNDLCAILMPQFTYKKGQLYIATRMVEDVFINKGLNIDAKFSIPFKEKVDARDSRPLSYEGRLAVPGHVEDSDYIFKKTPLMQGRTELVDMMPGSKMKSIEDVSETALPSSTDIDGGVKGAAKAAQLGTDAMDKLLRAATDNITMQNRSCVIFMEMNMLTGDMFDAFVDMRTSYNYPTYYVSLTSSEMQLDWFMHTKRQNLKDKHLNGELIVPGISALPERIPEDVLEKSPDPPSLSKLVKSADGQNIMVPEALVKQWYQDSTYGQRFKAFMDSFHEDLWEWLVSVAVVLYIEGLSISVQSILARAPEIRASKY